jgi:alkanesulfonate monooxygenase
MLTVYTTMPGWDGSAPAEYQRNIIEQARWSEEAGCRGALVYSDPEQLEAWTTAQLIVAKTERFVPLIAANPVYMHPFSVAQMVSTIGFLYQRTVDLNLVSGGFEVHLRQLGCRLDHQQRYEQLTEYGQIVMNLLAGKRPTSHRGAYYTLSAASLAQPLDPGLTPNIYVSGASEDCARAQQNLAIDRLTYPREPSTYAGVAPLAAWGVKIGIIARSDSADAWRAAHRRFPRDPSGEQSHDWASKLVKSHWRKQQFQDALAESAPNGAYWLYPFRAFRTFAPYLVGSYDEVGEVFARYRDLGVRTVILDHPTDPDDLHHALTALAHSDPARTVTRTVSGNNTAASSAPCIGTPLRRR